MVITGLQYSAQVFNTHSMMLGYLVHNICTYQVILKLTTLTQRLVRLMLRQKSTCIPVLSDTSSTFNRKVKCVKKGASAPFFMSNLRLLLLYRVVIFTHSSFTNT